jgi:hypothetical protein
MGSRTIHPLLCMRPDYRFEDADFPIMSALRGIVGPRAAVYRLEKL